MTGQEKTQEVMQQLAEIKSNIQKKYDKVMGKITDLQQELSFLDTAMNQTEIWIEKQKTKIQGKINKLKKDIEDWLRIQMGKAQKWLDNIKQEILDFIAKLLISPVLALTGI